MTFKQNKGLSILYKLFNLTEKYTHSYAGTAQLCFVPAFSRYIGISRQEQPSNASHRCGRLRAQYNIRFCHRFKHECWNLWQNLMLCCSCFSRKKKEVT